MRSIGYHFFEDGSGLYKSSRKSEERPLIINCAGNFYTESSINTHCAGRLDHYFLFIAEGELLLETPLDSVTLSEGDFVIIPPSTPYSYIHNAGAPIYYFWVHFTGSFADKIASRYELKVYPETNGIKSSADMIGPIKKFTDVCASEEKFKEEELSILFERMLLTLGRRAANKAAIPLKRSISHINAFYNTELRIPSLAKMEGLSVSRYNAIFKSTMGMPPTEYIIKTRLSFACELLSTTSLAIKEVAVLVGYSDAHFFSRIFRTNIGVSPLEYRQRGT